MKQKTFSFDHIIDIHDELARLAQLGQAYVNFEANEM